MKGRLSKMGRGMPAGETKGGSESREPPFVFPAGIPRPIPGRLPAVFNFWQNIYRPWESPRPVYVSIHTEAYTHFIRLFKKQLNITPLQYHTSVQSSIAFSYLNFFFKTAAPAIPARPDTAKTTSSIKEVLSPVFTAFATEVPVPDVCCTGFLLPPWLPLF